MRTEVIVGVALSVAVFSLACNYVQHRTAQQSALEHERQLARIYVDNRKKAMHARAEAFEVLVLGKRGVNQLQSSNEDYDTWDVEFGVLVPDEKQAEFIEWMAGYQKMEELFVPATMISRQSGIGETTAHGPCGEIKLNKFYERFSFSWQRHLPDRVKLQARNQMSQTLHPPARGCTAPA